MKTILVVEDAPSIRENIAEILELANYKVITAENGKIGVEKALHEKPDLILCDIMMPILDGYGVLHLLHKNPVLKNTPFIFMTAKTERAEMRKGMELGADDYITKPFEESELLNAIETRFNRLKALREELSHEMVVPPSNENEETLSELFISGRESNEYGKKQLIYAEGHRPLWLFYVKKGKVKTYKSNENGKDLVVGLYNEGDFLGHIALLEGTAYGETAEALEDTELAKIPRKDFEHFVFEHPAIARKFTALLAKDINDKEDKMVGLAYNSLRKKVAETLIALHGKYRSGITLSRETLANIAGTATESLIRTLADFKSERLIDIKDGIVVVLNEHKLARMVN